MRINCYITVCERIRRAGCILALVFLAAIVWANPRMTAHFIDVGQADATLLEFPCGAVLIDAGAQDDAHVAALTEYLRKFFARRTDLNNTLESVLITHNHLDHTMALRAVVENFKVERYLDHGMLEGPGTAHPNWLRQQAAARGIVVREIVDAQVEASVAAVYDRRTSATNQQPAVIDRRYSNRAAPICNWYKLKMRSCNDDHSFNS